MRPVHARSAAACFTARPLRLAALALCAVTVKLGGAPVVPAAAPAVAASSEFASDAVSSDDRRLLADGLFSRGLYELASREYAVLADDRQTTGRDVVLFRLGECWRRLKQGAQAEAAYDRLAREFPDSPERARAQLQHALLAAEGNRPAEAAALLKPLVEGKLPDDIRGAALHALGESLDQTGDTAGACARFEQVRREQPASEYAAFSGLRLGFLLSRSTQAVDRARALAVYRDVASRTNSPRLCVEALFQGAELAFADRLFSASAASYAELRKRFPDDARTAGSSLSSAWAHHNAGLYAEALALADASDGARPEQRAEWLYLRANASRQLNRPGEAAALYSRLLSDFAADPHAPSARYERLLCLASLRDHRAVLQESAGFEPPESRRDNLLWLQGEAAQALDDLARATLAYRDLAERFPGSPFAADALFRLGWLQQRQCDWRQASASYRRLRQLAPGHALAASALFSEGVCLAQAGEGSNALLAWDALIKQYPQYEGIDQALYQKAMEEIRSGALAAAVGTLNDLLSRFPRSGRRADALFWRASVRRQQGVLDPAMADLRELVRTGSGSEIEREARLLLGTLLQQQGQDAEAAACFQPLLDEPGRARLPADRLAWLCEFQFGRAAYPEAEAAARTLIAREQDAAWRQTGWTLLARSVRAQRRPEEAMDALTHALEGDARTRFGAEAALRLGEMLLDAGRFAEAETRLRDAAARASAPELQRFRAYAYAALGRCAELRGDPDAAIRHYLAVSILYDDATLVPAALHKAATLLALAGRQDESQVAARELVQRYPASSQAQAWRGRTGAEAPLQPAAAGKGPP